ncbi:MAG TPA: hypothetical protein VFU10_10430 [Gaiellaceae bacterium]|nr:hypothetical protein [Gaiellaceae bacterium]
MKLRFWRPSRTEQAESLASRAWNWKTAVAVGVDGALGGLAYGGLRAVRRSHPQAS